MRVLVCTAACRAAGGRAASRQTAGPRNASAAPGEPGAGPSWFYLRAVLGTLVATAAGIVLTAAALLRSGVLYT